MTRVLVTGANGYLGSRIVAACLRAGRSVTAWVHATDQAELETRGCQLMQCAGGDVVCTGGDLGDPQAFESVAPGQISAIVHSAAVTRFDVDRETAERINVLGTRRLARLAARCPNLERLVLLGSAYASGLQEGDIDEGLLNPPGFANHYEWSKWQAEMVLYEDYPDLPWTVIRAATILADDSTGLCGQLNVVHDTLRLLYQGLLAVLPGDPSVPVSLMTADAITRAVTEILRRPYEGRFVNACPPAGANPTLGALVRQAMATFESFPDFKRRRIQAPPFCRREAFQLLVDGLRRHGGDLTAQVVGGLAPFSPQMYIHKRFVTCRMDRLVQPALPDMQDLVGKVCERMVSAGFCGRRGPARKTA